MMTEQATSTRIRRATIIGFVTLLGIGGLAYGLVIRYGARQLGPSVPTAHSSLATLTDTLRSATTPGKQAGDVRALQATARQRKSLLLRRWQEDPGATLPLLIDSATRELLPATVQPEIEQEQTRTGTYRVEHTDDFKHGVSRNRHQLMLEDGASLTLYFSREPSLQSNARITIKGIELADSIFVPDGDAASTSVNTITRVETPPTVATTGTLSVAVILVNFSDQPTNQPATAQQVRQAAFTDADSISNYYAEASGDRLTLTGDVFEDDNANDGGSWYTVPATPGVCNTSVWQTAMESLLAADDVNLNEYDFRVMVTPTVSACLYDGVGGGNEIHINIASISWYWKYVLTHELGHGLSLGHAWSVRCTPPLSGQNCAYSEYGDQYDPMGFTTSATPLPHFHNRNKFSLGWMPAQDVTEESNPPSSRDYTIYPVTSTGPGTKLLFFPTDGYYLEMRKNFGVFEQYGAGSPSLNGVFIRSVVSVLQDANPATTQTLGEPFTVGQTVTDPVKGVRFTVLSVTPEVSATIRVEHFCVRANPLVSVNPFTQWGGPGVARTYSVEIKNVDTVSCGASVFDLSATVPPGFASAGLPSAATLQPQETQTLSLTVTAAGEAGEGTYSLSAEATNRDAGMYHQSGSAVYKIDLTPPTVTINAPANAFVGSMDTPITIDASMTDPNQVDRADIFIDDVSVKQCVRGMFPLTRCTYTWASPTSGLHAIRVTAHDSAQPPNIGSASVQIRIRAGSREPPQEIAP